MLVVADMYRDYFEEVKAFAENIGKWDTEGVPDCLKPLLDWLGAYSDHVTECVLTPDRPYGFDFTMYSAFRVHTCLSCQHTWIHKVVLSGEKTVQCPKCSEHKNSVSDQVEWKRWFNGGLLYHGPVDGFGSGSSPVFAVTLTPVYGWSVHT